MNYLECVDCEFTTFKGSMTLKRKLYYLDDSSGQDIKIWIYNVRATKNAA